MTEPKKYRRLCVLVTPVALCNFECDDIEFAGPTMIIYRDDLVIAQFATWAGWFWVADSDLQDGRRKLELASVTTITPVNRMAETPPGDAA